MNEALVLTTDREHALRVRGESGAHNVLAMASVALSGVSVVECGVAIDIDETPVIARNEELVVGADLHLVDVGAIFA